MVFLLEDDLQQMLMIEMVLTLLCKQECLCAGSFSAMVQLGPDLFKCDLALLDVNLGPHQPSGLDAYSWLRQNGFAGRVCFATGHARSHPEISRLLEAREVSVLEKPFDVQQLREVLDGEDR